MPIYNISCSDLDYSNWDLDEEHFNLDRITDYDLLIDEMKRNSEALYNIDITHLLTFFDSVSKSWLLPESNFFKNFGHLGIHFLSTFMKRSNLSGILKESLRGNINFLNTFCRSNYLDKKIMAQPRGIITHWLAGNVPVLGLLSLIQGILTKNCNIIKLPMKNGKILPAMFQEILEYECELGNGESLKGNFLEKTVKFIYCEKDDIDSQKKLSFNSDVRVAWGGKDAIYSVTSLPRKYGTEDVIFGPKYSFAVIDKYSLNDENVENVCYKLAMDASVFEQQGCNSPHTLFVEKGGKFEASELATILAKGMAKVLKRIPKEKISSAEAISVVNLRAKYDFIGEVYCSSGTEWTVVYSNEVGFAVPCYSRTIFVRPIDDISEIHSFVDHNRQTLGILIEETRKIEFSRQITRLGIERITEIGKMMIYDHPWDGMFPLDRFVRWVSLG